MYVEFDICNCVSCVMPVLWILYNIYCGTQMQNLLSKWFLSTSALKQLASWTSSTCQANQGCSSRMRWGQWGKTIRRMRKTEKEDIEWKQFRKMKKWGKTKKVRAEHVKLSWNPPEDDGGTPILKYLLRFKSLVRFIWQQSILNRMMDLDCNEWITACEVLLLKDHFLNIIKTMF